jgi:hypothetical protein
MIQAQLLTVDKNNKVVAKIPTRNDLFCGDDEESVINKGI